MEHRLAVYEDIQKIMEIIAQAQRFLRENGVDQWQNGYPSAEIFKRDIDKQRCHVYFDSGVMLGVICVYFEPDPNYLKIIDGDWLSRSQDYATIHRSAVADSARGKGVAAKMFADAELLAKENGMGSIRVDTHKNNKAMQGLLKKLDFCLCGAIYLQECEPDEDAHRLAFEKVF